MSLKVFLILAPIAVGGYVVSTREAAPAGGNETAQAELVKAAAPVRRSAAECRLLEQRQLEASAANPVPDGLAAMQRVQQMYRELREQGCEPGGGPGTAFEAPPVAQMGPAPGGTGFEAGRPMVDVSRGRSR